MEIVLLKARALRPKDASIAFNLACYASVTGRMEEAKVRLQQAIDLHKIARSEANHQWRRKPTCTLFESSLED